MACASPFAWRRSGSARCRDRGAPRRHQGSRGARGRLPGECGELAYAAAGSQASGLRAPALAVGDGALGFWAACGTCGPRRRDNAVGCIGSPTCWISYPKSTTAGQAGAARDHVRGDTRRRRARDRSLHGGLPGHVSEGPRADRTDCSRTDLSRSTTMAPAARIFSRWFDA
jgi:hypothetical protein